MSCVVLYPFQQRAVEQLHNGAVLCGSPGKSVGSGKSITALAYYWSKVCGGCIDYSSGAVSPMASPRSLLILTTPRKRDSLEWEKELTRFGLSTHIDASAQGVSVMVDSWNRIGSYLGVTDAFVIFDEQKALSGGKWGRSFVKIARRNQWIMLSATPGDTWRDYCQVFVANGFYRNRTEFEDTHIIFDRWARYPKVKSYRGIARLRTNRDRVLVRMDVDRRTERHIEWVDYSYDVDGYLRLQKARRDPETGVPYRDASSLCNALRKHCGASEGHSERFISLVREHPRVIVFYNYSYELHILRDLAEREGVHIAELNGENHDLVPPPNERWWYLVQYAAGAEAWNCTATDTMIFWSANYSWRRMEQAYGRIDRINTPYRDLHYYIMTCSSSIERSVRNAISRKEKFNEKAFASAIGGEGL